MGEMNVLGRRVWRGSLENDAMFVEVKFEITENEFLGVVDLEDPEGSALLGKEELVIESEGIK